MKVSEFGCIDNLKTSLIVKEQLLLSPGPSNCSERVLQALSQPVLGNFNETTFKVMDEIKEGLKYLFQTRNEMTLAVSSAGHGGTEAALSNLVEDGDKVLMLPNGYWCLRAANIATRNGGKVITLEGAPGTTFSLEQIEDSIKEHRPKILFVTHGDSATGVLQPVAYLGDICHRYECLLVVDAVASLGGVPFFTDLWGVDCVYTGSQKTLGAPPGITPISFSALAMDKINKRKTETKSYYFDIKLVGQYWNCFPDKARAYHCTICSTLLYGLREALSQIVEEGLENMIKRHLHASQLLSHRLKQLNFEFEIKNPEARLPTIIVVRPPRVLPDKLIQILLHEFDIEIGFGLLEAYGKCIRIGVLGVNANEKTINYAMDKFQEALLRCQL